MPFLVPISLYQIRYIKCLDFPIQKTRKGTTGFLTVSAISIETSHKTIIIRVKRPVMIFSSNEMAHALAKMSF